jgi:hypothetical protein
MGNWFLVDKGLEARRKKKEKNASCYSIILPPEPFFVNASFFKDWKVKGDFAVCFVCYIVVVVLACGFVDYGSGDDDYLCDFCVCDVDVHGYVA